MHMYLSSQKKVSPLLLALILGAAIASFSLPAAAHHPNIGPSAGSSGGGAGPVVTRSPDTLPAGKWTLSAHVEFIDMADIPDDRLEQFGAEDVEGVLTTEK